MLTYPGGINFPFSSHRIEITRFSILIMVQFTKTLHSKREAWINRIKREAFVKNEILNNSKPSVYNISTALDLPPPKKIK